MGSSLVAVDNPPMRSLANIIESSEEVLVKYFLTEGPVEALDEGVLVGLTRLDVLDRHAVGLELVSEHFTEKLGPIVRAHHLRQAVVVLDLLEHTHQSLRVDRGVDFDVQCLAVEVVDGVEGAKAPTTSQGIAHEVH